MKFIVKCGKNIIPLKRLIENGERKRELGNYILELAVTNINGKNFKILGDKCSDIEIKYIFMYGEVTNTSEIKCFFNNSCDLSILYYSDVYKEIYYDIIDVKKTDRSFTNFNFKLYEDMMDPRFLTLNDKINKMVENKFQYKELNTNDDFSFPLCEQTYDHREVNAMINVLLGDKLTMGSNVREFETQFASYIGSKYAVMVNSGSSANLLAMAVLSNFKYEKKLSKGDKVLVPAVCWSTSVWPIIQMGLVPMFVDINIKTLNADIDLIEQLIQNDDKIKGMVVVHILGNSTNMKRLMEFKKKYDLILMEDTCESLGSKYNGQFLGTFGECGTYSFYFSHHITTIEGGMVVTNDFKIYELLKCLRAHGWSRELMDYKSNELDNRFCFVNVGYNLRPMEIQGAMGKIQLEKLEEFNKNRLENYTLIIKKIKEAKSDILTTFENETLCEPAWFSLPLILNKKYDKEEYMKYLESNNIDTRPIVTGNFTRQPVFKHLNYNIDPSSFKMSEIIHEFGFFIGIPSKKIPIETIDKLVNILINYKKNT